MRISDWSSDVCSSDLLDHRAQAIAPGRRHEACGVDGLQRLVAQLVGVHRDEPLRGVAEDERRLGAPGVRIAVRQLALGAQAAGLGQRLHDAADGRSEEHTSEIKSLMRITYAGICL